MAGWWANLNLPTLAPASTGSVSPSKSQVRRDELVIDGTHEDTPISSRQASSSATSRGNSPDSVRGCSRRPPGVPPLPLPLASVPDEEAAACLPSVESSRRKSKGAPTSSDNLPTEEDDASTLKRQEFNFYKALQTAHGREIRELMQQSAQRQEADVQVRKLVADVSFARESAEDVLTSRMQELEERLRFEREYRDEEHHKLVDMLNEEIHDCKADIENSRKHAKEEVQASTRVFTDLSDRAHEREKDFSKKYGARLKKLELRATHCEQQLRNPAIAEVVGDDQSEPATSSTAPAIRPVEDCDVVAAESASPVSRAIAALESSISHTRCSLAESISKEVCRIDERIEELAAKMQRDTSSLHSRCDSAAAGLSCMDSHFKAMQERFEEQLSKLASADHTESRLDEMTDMLHDVHREAQKAEQLHESCAVFERRLHDLENRMSADTRGSPTRSANRLDDLDLTVLEQNLAQLTTSEASAPIESRVTDVEVKLEDLVSMLHDVHRDTQRAEQLHDASANADRRLEDMETRMSLLIGQVNAHFDSDNRAPSEVYDVATLPATPPLADESPAKAIEECVVSADGAPSEMINLKPSSGQLALADYVTSDLPVDDSLPAYDAKLREVLAALSDSAAKLADAEAIIRQQCSRPCSPTSTELKSPDRTQDAASAEEVAAQRVSEGTAEAEVQVQEDLHPALSHREESLGTGTCLSDASSRSEEVRAAAVKLEQAQDRIKEQLHLALENLHDRLPSSTPKMAEHRLSVREPEAETSPVCPEQLPAEADCLTDAVLHLESRIAEVGTILEVGFHEALGKLGEAEARFEDKSVMRLKKRMREALEQMTRLEASLSERLDECEEGLKAQNNIERRLLWVERRLDGNRHGASKPRFEPGMAMASLCTPRDHSPVPDPQAFPL